MRRQRSGPDRLPGGEDPGPGTHPQRQLSVDGVVESQPDALECAGGVATITTSTRAIRTPVTTSSSCEAASAELEGHHPDSATPDEAEAYPASTIPVPPGAAGPAGRARFQALAKTLVKPRTSRPEPSRPPRLLLPPRRRGPCCAAGARVHSVRSSCETVTVTAPRSRPARRSPPASRRTRRASPQRHQHPEHQHAHRQGSTAPRMTTSSAPVRPDHARRDRRGPGRPPALAEDDQGRVGDHRGRWPLAVVSFTRSSSSSRASRVSRRSRRILVATARPALPCPGHRPRTSPRSPWVATGPGTQQALGSDSEMRLRSSACSAWSRSPRRPRPPSRRG